MSYEIQKAKTGALTLIFSDEGRSVRLHSVFDPLSEANRLAEAFEKGRSSHILISGLALGYHVAALRQKYPETSFLIFEADSEVKALCKKHNPESTAGCSVVSSKEELAAFFEDLDIRSFKGVASYIHRPSFQLHSDFYEELSAAAKEQISSRISDMLTRFEFEERWIENIFANLPELYRAIPVSRLFGKFRGYAGIIVSAGPSLRKNISRLAELKSRALIVCVDTAYKVCLKNGINPHIVMTIDAQKHSVKHFSGTTSNSLLVADIVSCPAVMRSYLGSRSLSTTAKYFTDSKGISYREPTVGMKWFEKRIEPLGDLQSGGSVATSAFDLLLNAGCNPIILIGQDLAYTGREIHSAGTYHNEEWLPGCSRLKNLDTINQGIIRRRSTKRVPAWGEQGKALTDFVLDLYRLWFQDASLTSGLTVVNATEGGARIDNTKEKKLEDIAGELPKQKKSPEKILSHILSSTKTADKGSLAEDLKKASVSLSSLRSMALNGACLDELEDFAKQNGITELIEPLLGKIRFFTERKGMGTEEAQKSLAEETASAAQKLLAVISKTLKRIEP